jgi:hypothetical protein
MIVTCLILGSVLLGVTLALGSFTLTESAKVLLLGLILLGLVVWKKSRENS